LIHPHQLRIVAATLAATALVTAAGCTNTRPGDPPSTPPANKYGDGGHISSALTPPGFFGPAPWVQPSNINSSNCIDPVDTSVGPTGLTVTAVDTWDETGNGAVGTVYVQDTISPTPLYGAMPIFDPTFSPPDLKVLPGNLVDVQEGVYEEYVGPSDFGGCNRFCECETLPQLAGALKFDFDGTVPEPVTIGPNDLGTYANARPYMGMLVTVKGVTIQANGSPSDGRYTAKVDLVGSFVGSTWDIDDELWDVPHLMPLSAGQTFVSVTGIVTYFGTVNLAPRSAADFKTAEDAADAGDGGP